MRIRFFQSDSEILSELGRRIKVHRVQMNLTQAEFAKKVGISKPTITKLERGLPTTALALIRTMRGLNEADRIEHWLEEPPISIALLEKINQGQAHQRVRRPKTIVPKV